MTRSRSTPARRTQNRKKSTAHELARKLKVLADTLGKRGLAIEKLGALDAAAVRAIGIELRATAAHFRLVIEDVRALGPRSSDALH
jgi:hypothetical protein